MKNSLKFLIFLFALPHVNTSAATIHIVGDSHGFFCFNNKNSFITKDEQSFFHYTKNNLSIDVPFYIHWLGSLTMNRIGRDGVKGLNIKQLGVVDGDVVVFVFGEIDVRCHIGKQRDQMKRNLDEILHTLSKNYINTIVSNKELFNTITCFICSITPPCDRGFNAVYPFYGTLEERVAITRLLNKTLEKEATANGINYLDIYSLFAANDGSLSIDNSDGIVHINPHLNFRIKETLIDLILKI